MFRYHPNLACAALCSIAAPAAAAHPEDASINSVYDGLRQARAANDLDGMASAFGPGGLLIDARPGPAISGDELGARLKPMVARVKAEGVKIETGYRIERRSVLGDVALDAGFMRQTITRPGTEPTVRHARFLTTLQRDPSGRWRIIGDASMTVDKAQFDGVAKVEGLTYDG